MRIETAKAIVRAADEHALEMSIREDYSGRGTFGETTAAVVYESDIQLLQAVAQAAADIHGSETSVMGFGVQGFVEDINCFRMDKLGRFKLVY